MAGECLGILGAVDPGRLVGNNADLSAANADVDCVPLAVTEETFVVDLVNVLIRDQLHATFALPAARPPFCRVVGPIWPIFTLKRTTIKLHSLIVPSSLN